MECDGPTAVNNGTCHEKCTCHPDDNDALSVARKPIYPHTQIKKPRKKFLHPHIGHKEMNRIQDLFSKWIHEYGDGFKKVTKVGKTIKDERFKFFNNMMRNYQHLRGKEKALRLLEEEQSELRNQQEHLQNLLTKQEKALTRTATHNEVATPSAMKYGRKRPHGDDVNITITTSNTTQAPPTTQAPLNQYTLLEIEGIKKQISEIQVQYQNLSIKQTQLAADLEKEQALFEQARQLIALLVKQNQGVTNSSPATSQTQSDFGGVSNDEELRNGGPAQGSELLNRLQNVLSQLLLTDDGTALQNDGRQLMLLQQNQDQDQFEGIKNGNSINDKSEDAYQEPNNMMYSIPVEIDRNDLNSQEQRNSLFERNEIGDDGENDDEYMPFVMDRDYSDEEIEPESTTLEKKTLISPNSNVNTRKTSRRSKKYKSKLKEKDKSSGQTKKHRDRKT